MSKTPKKRETKDDPEVRVAPKEGDAILRRMLRTKPKTHDEMRRVRADKGKRARDGDEG